MFTARAVVAVMVAGTLSLGVMSTARAATALPVPTHVLIDGQDGGPISGIPTITWDRIDGASSYNAKVTSSPDGTGTMYASVSSTVNSHYVPTVQLPTNVQLYAEVQAAGGAWSYGVGFIRSTVAPPSNLRTVDANGSVVDSYQAPAAPVFTWDPVPGATSYTIQVSGTGDFADSSHYQTYTTGATLYALTQMQQPEIDTNTGEVQPWTWRVMATLGNGITTAYTSTQTYRIEPLDRSQPVSPTPGDIVDGASTDLALDWAPVAGAATYDLQWSTDWQFKNGVSEVDNIVSTRYTPTTTWSNTTWYWRVKGVDAGGYSEPWWNISTQTDPSEWSFTRKWSAQPTLEYPAMDAVVTGSGDTPLMFQWSGVRLATNYTLQYRPWAATGDSLTANWDGNPSVRTCLTTLTTVTPTVAPAFCNGFTAGTTYAWRVLATDGPAGIKSEDTASPAAIFTYQPVTRTATTAQPSPATGYQVAQNGTDFFAADASPSSADSERCAGYTCTNLRQTPVLRWDDTPGATMWHVYIAKDQPLTNLLNGYSNTTPVTVTQPYYAPTSQFPDTQAGETGYWWKVVPCATATDCADKDAADYSFTKLSEAPQAHAPETSTPAGTSTPCSTACADDVTLSWDDYLDTETASYDSPGTGADATLATYADVEPKQYQVQWASDPSFTNDTGSATVDGTSFTRSSSTFPEGTVYWRVQPIDANGNLLAPSTTQSFTKKSPTPTVPASTTWTGAFDWQPLPFAASYDLELYPKVVGVDPGANTAIVSGTTEQTTYTPGRIAVGDYWWHVRRTDASRHEGGWSTWGEVTVTGVGVTLDAPANGASDLPPSDAVLSWEPADSAAAYQVTLTNGTTTVRSPATPALAWAPTSQLAGGSWTWSVSALDGTGTGAHVLGTSAPRDFAVVDHPSPLSAPIIQGSPQVGSQLTAVPGDWSLDGVTDTFQWYRDSAPIKGATSSTYVLVPADLGHSISVTVTGSRPGYVSGIAQSTGVAVAAGPALVPTAAPTITGTPKVGQSLSVQGGSWPNGARLSYRWLRDGVPITGATGIAHRLSVDDAGSSISARVTATLAGYTPGSAGTAAVQIERIASSTSASVSTVRVRKKQKAIVTVSVTANGATPTGTVQLLDKGKRVASKALRSGRATLKYKKHKPGKHKLQVRYLGSAQVAGSSSKKLKIKVTR